MPGNPKRHSRSIVARRRRRQQQIDQLSVDQVAIVAKTGEIAIALAKRDEDMAARFSSMDEMPEVIR